ncbi:hypothetical protein [Tropicimonas marinistellae]|uniref:hypothetical protein n=1 Tax=Tropicimonas marinistellae TaxID=1739787 RepID=UPI0008333200|nr:hypothetical protein [Tropicimonas marinistellae]
MVFSSVRRLALLLSPVVLAGCATNGVCTGELPKTPVARQNLMTLPDGCAVNSYGVGGVARLDCDGGRIGFAIVDTSGGQ